MKKVFYSVVVWFCSSMAVQPNQQSLAHLTVVLMSLAQQAGIPLGEPEITPKDLEKVEDIKNLHYNYLVLRDLDRLNELKDLIMSIGPRKYEKLIQVYNADPAVMDKILQPELQSIGAFNTWYDREQKILEITEKDFEAMRNIQDIYALYLSLRGTPAGLEELKKLRGAISKIIPQKYPRIVQAYNAQVVPPEDRITQPELQSLQGFKDWYEREEKLLEVTAKDLAKIEEIRNAFINYFPLRGDPIQGPKRLIELKAEFDKIFPAKYQEVLAKYNAQADPGEQITQPELQSVEKFNAWYTTEQKILEVTKEDIAALAAINKLYKEYLPLRGTPTGFQQLKKLSAAVEAIIPQKYPKIVQEYNAQAAPNEKITQPELQSLLEFKDWYGQEEKILEVTTKDLERMDEAKNAFVNYAQFRGDPEKGPGRLEAVKSAIEKIFPAKYEKVVKEYNTREQAKGKKGDPITQPELQSLKAFTTWYNAAKKFLELRKMDKELREMENLYKDEIFKRLDAITTEKGFKEALAKLNRFDAILDKAKDALPGYEWLYPDLKKNPPTNQALQTWSKKQRAHIEELRKKVKPPKFKPAELPVLAKDHYCKLPAGTLVTIRRDKDFTVELGKANIAPYLDKKGALPGVLGVRVFKERRAGALADIPGGRAYSLLSISGQFDYNEWFKDLPAGSGWCKG